MMLASEKKFTNNVKGVYILLNAQSLQATIILK